MLKTSLLSSKILTLRYSFFKSFNDYQLAFSVSLNHAVSCCSVSGYRVQKSIKVRFAMILKLDLFSSKMVKCYQFGIFNYFILNY
jgi:hypothetical protein